MSYSGNTLAFQAKARGSIPLIRFYSQSIGFSNSTLEQIWAWYVLCPHFSPIQCYEIEAVEWVRK